MGSYRALPNHIRASTFKVGDVVQVPKENGVALRGVVAELGFFIVRVVVDGDEPEGMWISCDALTGHKPVYPKVMFY